MNFENLKPAAMDIKVLGTGCSKCKTLEKTTKQVIKDLGIDAEVEKVDDIQKIMEYGIMHTPGLVINGKVILSGRVPKTSELTDILTQNK